MFRSRRRWTRRDELRLCFPKIFPCFASLVQITFRLRFNGNDRASLRARSTMARVMGMENTRFTGEQYSYPILSATTRYNGKTTEMCFSIPSKYILTSFSFLCNLRSHSIHFPFDYYRKKKEAVDVSLPIIKCTSLNRFDIRQYDRTYIVNEISS